MGCETGNCICHLSLFVNEFGVPGYVNINSHIIEFMCMADLNVYVIRISDMGNYVSHVTTGYSGTVGQ